MKNSQVTDLEQRQELVQVIESLFKEPADEGEWLRDASAKGVPIYGSEPEDSDMLLRLNPDNSQEIVRHVCRKKDE